MVLFKYKLCQIQANIIDNLINGFDLPNQGWMLIPMAYKKITRCYMKQYSENQKTVEKEDDIKSLIKFI